MMLVIEGIIKRKPQQGAVSGVAPLLGGRQTRITVVTLNRSYRLHFVWSICLHCQLKLRDNNCIWKMLMFR